jgi:hypothetical protein
MYLLVTIQKDQSKVAVATLPTLVPGFSVVNMKLFIGEERGPTPQAPSPLTAGELLERRGRSWTFAFSRLSQYSRSAGSSGDAVPLTKAWCVRRNQANFRR